MIFAAGLGTRLKPWTDAHPKALAIVNGKSLLQRNVEYLQQYGITQVIVNVHHFADQIIQAVQDNSGWGSDITISDETAEVLETGGGLKKAAWYFEGEQEAVVMNVDILTDLNLVAMAEWHRNNKGIAALATTFRNSSRCFLFNRQLQLCGWENQQTKEQKISRPDLPLEKRAFSGVHIINPELLSLIQLTGKFSMVDVYLSLAGRYNIFAFDHSGGRFIDVGKPESVLIAEKLFL